MQDTTRSQKDDLRFLLKDKYHFSEVDIEKILHGVDNSLLTEELKNDIQLLKSGYPLDYIIGYTEFLGLKINLNHKPLIPRPETEYWTQKIVNSVSHDSNLNILDMFCGSGCIGLALLKNFPNANCTFSDINPDFLSQTKQNADINHINIERLQLIESNIFSNISGTFDLIVANPPYVSKHEEVGAGIEHEPESAIFAQKNGFELIEKFLQDASGFIANEGRIFMEFGETQKDKVEELLRIYKYTNWDFHKDQFDKWRWVEIY
jgi:release factor glutamine methyltransferase